VYKIIITLVLALFSSASLASGSLEFASKEVARALTGPLTGRTATFLDLRDQAGDVRELGRIFADQYLRLDVAAMGVRTITRNQLVLTLNNLGQTQESLLNTVVGGKTLDLRGVDTLVSGSLSLLGDRYVIVAEALDIKTGVVLITTRADFPQTPTLAATWANILEKGDGIVKPSGGNAGVVVSTSLFQKKIAETNFGGGYETIEFFGCARISVENVKCVFRITHIQDGTWTNQTTDYFIVDEFGRRFNSSKAAYKFLIGDEEYNKLTFYAKVAFKLELTFNLIPEIKQVAFLEMKGCNNCYSWKIPKVEIR
jgi:hypothetical protein